MDTLKALALATHDAVGHAGGYSAIIGRMPARGEVDEGFLEGITRCFRERLEGMCPGLDSGVVAKALDQFSRVFYSEVSDQGIIKIAGWAVENAERSFARPPWSDSELARELPAWLASMDQIQAKLRDMA